MKIFAISDLHLSLSCDKPMDRFGDVWKGQLELLKQHCDRLLREDDLLLIAGDISWAMREQDARMDLEYIETLKGQKVLIRGNHDFWWNTASKVRRMLPPSVHIVHNDALKFGDVVVCGNRGINLAEKDQADALYQKHYAREMERFDLSIKAMHQLRAPGDRTVFMTHYPPFLHNKQSSEVTQKFTKAGVDSVVYGHVHFKHLKQTPSHNFLCSELDGVQYYLTSSDLLGHCPIEILAGEDTAV